MEALSLSGVPIYSEGGHGGGITLDEQYRTTLTGLHAPEVRTLFVASNTAVLRDVGLGEAAERLCSSCWPLCPLHTAPPSITSASGS